MKKNGQRTERNRRRLDAVNREVDHVLNGGTLAKSGTLRARQEEILRVYRAGLESERFEPEAHHLDHPRQAAWLTSYELRRADARKLGIRRGLRRLGRILPKGQGSKK